MIPSKHNSIQGQQIQQARPGFLVCHGNTPPTPASVFVLASLNCIVPVVERLLCGGPLVGIRSTVFVGWGIWSLQLYTF